MSDTITDTLRELQEGLAEAQERAEAAKAEWEQALNALSARQRAIESIQALLAATGTWNANSNVGFSGTLSTEVTRHRSPRSRTDILVVMSEDRPPGVEWTIADLITAFEARGWTVHMQRADAALKSMASRLVADGSLQRIKPGVFKLKPPADGVGGWTEIAE